MITLTYGNVPTWKLFKEQFDKEVDTNYYHIKNSILSTPETRVIEDGEYHPASLYREIQVLSELVFEGGPKAEEAGSMASSILETLGFEWI